MAVNRTSLRLLQPSRRPGLLASTSPSPCARHLATMAPPSNRRTAPPRRTPMLPRFIPSDVSSFMRTNGTAFTTPENRNFLARHGIELDNGIMARVQGSLGPGGGLGALCSKAGVQLGFSPRYIVSPQHLEYFSPFGHPAAPAIRARYLRQMREEPLWIMTNILAGKKVNAVVRIMASRRLKGHVFQALEDRGYRTRRGGGDECADSAGAKEIRGTLCIRIFNPLLAVNQPAEMFGQAVAETLIKMHESQERREPRPLRKTPTWST